KTLRIICAPTPLPTSPILSLLFPSRHSPGHHKKVQQAYPSVRVCARGNMLPCCDVQPDVVGRRSPGRARGGSCGGTGRTEEGPARDTPAPGFAPSLPTLRAAEAVLQLVHASRALPVVRAELQP